VAPASPACLSCERADVRHDDHDMGDNERYAAIQSAKLVVSCPHVAVKVHGAIMYALKDWQDSSALIPEKCHTDFQHVLAIGL